MSFMNVPDSFDVEGHRAEAVGGGGLEGPSVPKASPPDSCVVAAMVWQKAAAKVVNSSLRSRALIVLIGQLAMLAIGLWLGSKL